MSAGRVPILLRFSWGDKEGFLEDAARGRELEERHTKTPESKIVFRKF